MTEVANSHVVLIGMMGSGKTTVGRLLAARLGWPFWDNDEALLESTGKTAAELQHESGMAALHRIEDRLLREALRTPAHTVYAAAGSVVLHPRTVGTALTVWLRATPADERRNIVRSGQRHRPLPADPARTLERLSDVRLRAYERLADVTVDVAGEPAATCERVIKALVAITQSA